MNYQQDSIGQILLEARKRESKTQTDIANKLKIAPVYVCNIEKNYHIPSIELGAGIAEILRLDVREFLFLILRKKYPKLAHIFKSETE